MPRQIDISEKIKELRAILDKYSGIPSQSEDIAGYSAVNYYIRKHGDNPLIKELIDEYKITRKRRRGVDFESELKKIEDALEEEGKLPAVKDNPTLYNNVRYFFNKYKDRPEVEKLKYIYAHSSCYPLTEDRASKPDYYPKPEYLDDPHHDIYISCPPEYSRWKEESSFNYIKYVFSRYSELPARNTKPMVVLNNAINYWNRFQDKKIISFISDLIKDGCRDEKIIAICNTFDFDKKEIQERVREMLIEHGACSIHYIAQTAMPGYQLPDEFVYYYYYHLLNDKHDFRGICPLGELFSQANYSRVLYVHYSDYYKCNVEQIRKRVLNQNKKWREEQPITLDEWRDYGEYCFFIPQEHSDWCIPAYKTFDKSFPQNCFEDRHPYFRYYKSVYRYLDYSLFLAKNGYGELQPMKDYPSFSPISLADNWYLEREDDRSTAYELSRVSKECIADEGGATYSQTDDGLQLLFLPPGIKEYYVDERTTKLSHHAFSLCLDTLENIRFGANIRANYSHVICLEPDIRANYACTGIERCNNLKNIIIPFNKLKDYCKKFPKKSTLLFCDRNYVHLNTSAIYNGSILEWVPYTVNFIIPDGVTEVDEHAFYESDVKTVTFPGSIEKIEKGILHYCSTLEAVQLNEGVKEIKCDAFAKCENLKEVYIPNSLNSLYGTYSVGVFERCTSLDNIHLKADDLYLGKNCFKDCSSLNNIQIDGHIRHLGDSAFEGCTSLECIHLKANDLWIGSDCFRGCSSLINIQIDDHLRYLGNCAFQDCKSLTSIEFNNGIREMYYAFYGCTNLEYIYFRGDYESINNTTYGLNGCENLKAIYVPRKYYDLFLSKIDKDHAHLLIAED